jgi:hypothetical protein
VLKQLAEELVSERWSHQLNARAVDHDFTAMSEGALHRIAHNDATRA